MELCTLCPWLFPKVIPRMIEPLELRSPRICERVFFTRTPSSTIILFWVLMKSRVSLEKTSLSILAARIESFLVESSLRLGFFHVKIWASKNGNAWKIRMKKNIFLAKTKRENVCKNNEKVLPILQLYI